MVSGSTSGKSTSTQFQNFYTGVSCLNYLPNWCWLVSVYLCEVLYVITIGLIKISILLFYLQVFPTRSFRLRCWSVMGFVLASSFAFEIVTIFQCHPVSFAWNKDIHGTCINFNRVTWANAAFNILQDILIIVLPISEVRKLQLGRKKKIGLYIMFGLGSLWVTQKDFSSMLMTNFISQRLRVIHSSPLHSQKLRSYSRSNMGQRSNHFMDDDRSHHSDGLHLPTNHSSRIASHISTCVWFYSPTVINRHLSQRHWSISGTFQHFISEQILAISKVYVDFFFRGWRSSIHKKSQRLYSDYGIVEDQLEWICENLTGVNQVRRWFGWRNCI